MQFPAVTVIVPLAVTARSVPKMYVPGSNPMSVTVPGAPQAGWLPWEARILYVEDVLLTGLKYMGSGSSKAA